MRRGKLLCHPHNNDNTDGAVMFAAMMMTMVILVMLVVMVTMVSMMNWWLCYDDDGCVNFIDIDDGRQGCRSGE